jgi:peptide deformylase
MPENKSPKNQTEQKEFKLHLKLVMPHKNISRPVKKEDQEKVLAEAREMMIAMRRIEMNTKTEIFAAAHSQFRSSDPMRFFVLNPYNQFAQSALKSQGHNHTIIVNPVIKNHTKVPVDSSEGCVTFLNQKNTTMQRFHKITVDYDTFEVDRDDKGKRIGTKYVSIKSENVSSLLARIFQHEIDHMDAKYIFNFTKGGQKHAKDKGNN